MSDPRQFSDPTPAAPQQGDSGGDDARELVLVKHGQRFVFRYQPGDEPAMLDQLVEMVRDPACELDWFDAAMLSHQLGQRLGRRLDLLRKAS